MQINKLKSFSVLKIILRLKQEQTESKQCLEVLENKKNTHIHINIIDLASKCVCMCVYLCVGQFESPPATGSLTRSPSFCLSPVLPFSSVRLMFGFLLFVTRQGLDLNTDSPSIGPHFRSN